MIILGIESSCDDTSAALVEDGHNILSNVISSQNEFHCKFGGVVPEIASRKHLEAIIPVVDSSLESAGVKLKDIDGIAVTQGPGLTGALLIGLSFAKAAAYAQNKPIVGVNHLEAHLYANFLEGNRPPLPHVGLLVSGGHTALYFVKGYTDILLLGQTMDDAAGEAFDKVAKLLRLGYPGGIAIETIAKQGDENGVELPRALMKKNNLNFSFSGIKTAVLRYCQKNHPDFELSLNLDDNSMVRDYDILPGWIYDLAASFQKAVIDVLIKKTMMAKEITGSNAVVIAGGVSANQRLCHAMAAACNENNIEFFAPSPVLCTDNAAMVAGIGYHLFKKRYAAPLDLDAVSRFPSPPYYSE